MRDNKELTESKLHLDEFSAYLMSIDKSDSTIKTYIEHIQAFAKWFEETNGIDFNPATVTEIDIRDMRSYLQGTGHLKETTINLRLASLHKWKKYQAQFVSLINRKTRTNFLTNFLMHSFSIKS